MRAGMYVIHDGAAHQVNRIAAGAGYVDQHACKGRVSIYYLQPLDGGPLVFLTNPTADEVPLTPACEVCKLPAGHNVCAATDAHAVTEVAS